MSKRILQTILMVFSLVAMPAAHAALVNINKANAAAMVENLQGIGQKKAAAIVAYRRANGAFKSVDELLEVKGGGEKILNKNKKMISLTKGETTASSTPKKKVKNTKKPKSSTSSTSSSSAKK